MTEVPQQEPIINAFRASKQDIMAAENNRGKLVVKSVWALDQLTEKAIIEEMHRIIGYRYMALRDCANAEVSGHKSASNGGGEQTAADSYHIHAKLLRKVPVKVMQRVHLVCIKSAFNPNEIAALFMFAPDIQSALECVDDAYKNIVECYKNSSTMQSNHQESYV